ncbi:MAG: hypothetical protein WD492_00380 [Alkalispirochaeta sp.]
MLEIRLKPRTSPDGSVVLELGIGFRIVFGFLATIMAVGIGSSGTVGIVPAVALVIMVIGALYQEQWVLDPHAETVTARHGLMLLSRKRTWPFDQIEEVQYTQYRAGSVPGGTQQPPPGLGDTDAQEISSTMGRMTRGLRRHFLRYSLVTRDGGRIRIEMRKVTDWNADFKLPQTVAATLSVPLTETRL